MGCIVLLDTSIYLNVLDVPGNNQDRESVLDEFERRIERDDSFLLPMATIWETGNHIADCRDGATRWKYANIFVKDVAKALAGDTPYKATYFPVRDEFLEWLHAFPEFAKRNKSAKKTREGVSLADLSMIKEYERTCDRHPMSRVLIWSLDQDLQGYDRIPG